MTLRLHDTLSGETEPFEPVRDDEVLLYLCGLTTSDPAHLGHARAWVHTDVLHRWLEHVGYDVRHVENFTDVNEKVVARVGEDGESEADVGRHYVGEFLRDMRSLRLKRATVYPRVTEHVDEMLDMVETLVDAGYAYESDGSVYFDVTTFEGYGKLSNQSVEDLEPQGPEDERSEKRNAADFALWKAGGVTPGEIEEHRHDEAAPAAEACETARTWDSQWGEGRPGWHIECSAMSTTHLAETFDVHVAGEDLVFPHNENEIAQAEAATGEEFARFWLHVGLLETEDEKMSSSLGNFYTVAEAVDRFGTDVVRTYLCSATYSEKQTYSGAALDEARERFERLERGYERAVAAADSPDAGTFAVDDALRSAVDDARSSFAAAMNDDLNTREALAALLELTGAVHEHVDAVDATESADSTDDDATADRSAADDASADRSAADDASADRDAAVAAYDYQGLRRAIDAFEELGGGVLGLDFGGIDGGDVALVEDLVELVLDLREVEREAGNYDRADRLRDELEAAGVEVQDTDDGPTFRL